jgi:hypothetical protein
MSNLKVGIGLTFDGATGNTNQTGIATALGSGNIGINTTNINAGSIAGAAQSFYGLYINDGYIGFNSTMDRVGGYYIATHVNGLNAGPVTLGSTMTLDGTWVIV